MYGRAAFSPSGDRLAYTRGGLVAHLWRVPILEDRPATWMDAEQLTFEDAFAEYVDVSRDGRWVAYSSDRSGNHDLWILPADESGAARQLTNHPTPDWAPAWSPDGSEIAFYAFRTGTRDIWVTPVEPGPARRLVDLPGNRTGPRWSPDGTTVAFFGGPGTPTSGLWTAPASAAATQVLPFGAFPDWSPDGENLLFWRPPSLWRASSDGTGAEELPFDSGPYARWAPDGDTIYYLPPALDRISSYRISDGATTSLTDLKGRPGQLELLALATDGKYLYFSWRQDIGDIWVMDVVQD